MGTTAEKLAYLAETKNAIKNAIIGKGTAVPEGSTFRQLAQLINNITTGLSDEELAKADATESTVFSGKKFYAKDGTLRTGTALSQATNAKAADIAAGKKAYTSAGVLLNGTGTLVSGTAYKVYTGEVDSRTTKVYLDNIRYAMFGSSGLSSGDGVSYAGGTANTVDDHHVQVVLGSGQVYDAGYITITSSYISYTPGYISSLDYVVFCEV